MTVVGRNGFIAATILTASSDPTNSLEGIQTSGLIEGAGCFVQENDGEYLLFPADVQVPNGTTIVAALGGGNWILQSTASPSPGGSTYALLPRVIWVDAASVEPVETGSPAEPFKTLQAAINATTVNTPTQINVVGGGTYGAAVIPAQRSINFIATAAPLRTIIGAVTATLDVGPSTLRFEGFLIDGNMTIGQGASPPVNTTNVLLHNCEVNGDVNASTASGSSVYFSISCEAFVSGGFIYQINGAITGSGAGGQLFAKGQNILFGTTIANMLLGIFMEDVTLGGIAVVSPVISLSNIKGNSNTADGVANGALVADAQSLLTFTGFSNLTSVIDSGYGPIGAGFNQKSVVYVDANFPNAGAGSPGAPFNTVQRALDVIGAAAGAADDFKIVLAPGLYSEQLTTTLDYNLTIEGADYRNTRLGGDGVTHVFVVAGTRTLFMRELDCGQRSASNVNWTFGGGGSLGLFIEKCIFDVIDTSGIADCDLSVQGSGGSVSGGGGPLVPQINTLLGGTVTRAVLNSVVLSVGTAAYFLARNCELISLTTAGVLIDCLLCRFVANVAAGFAVNFTGAPGSVRLDKLSSIGISITNGAAAVIDP
jgi:hypothetical protein